MRIISIRKGFQADHSSTSYEFLAVDKKLKATEKKAVAKLSSRACPTDRRVSFIYNGDWSDLPGGWEPLMEQYYDVMYSESYDWWTLAIAFDADNKVIDSLKKYEFTGIEDLGVYVAEKNGRVIITISCRLDPSAEYFGRGGRSDYYEEYFDEDEEEYDEDSNDSFLDLLSENRKLLQKGDYRLLYGVWECYGSDEEEDEAPPKPKNMDKLPAPAKNLINMLTGI